MDTQIGIGRRWTRLLLVAPLLAAAIGLGMPAPAGAAYECNGSVAGGTIKQSVVVPSNASCFLTEVVVRGGITVEAGGILGTRSSEIRGSVILSNHQEFALHATEVRGSVTATGGTFATFVTPGTEIRGNLTFVGNSGSHVSVSGATVRGSVTINDNTTSVTMEVVNNRIDVDLSCANNSPAPTNLNQPNTVGGVASGQCAGL